jgi:hypothetical protein
LIRRPEDSFSREELRELCVLDRLRYAFSAAMLVLTERPMMELLLDSGR